MNRAWANRAWEIVRCRYPCADAEEREKIIWEVRGWAFWIGLGLAVVSLGLAYRFTDQRWLCVIIGAFWTFVPALWLMYEFGSLYKAYGKIDDEEDKEDLKYGQGIATKFWGGVAILLAVIYKFDDLADGHKGDKANEIEVRAPKDISSPKSPAVAQLPAKDDAPTANP